MFRKLARIPWTLSVGNLDKAFSHHSHLDILEVCVELWLDHTSFVNLQSQQEVGNGCRFIAVDNYII